MVVRSFPSKLVAVVAVLVLAGLVLAALAWPRGSGDAAPGPLVRADPATGPFEGLGVWVDIYDEPAWADPRAAAADMAAHGVRTLYLQSSNAARSSAFVFPEGTETFVDAAHDEGMRVVAWYLPHLTDLVEDRARIRDVLAYTTPRGDRFDGFGLDIESEAVHDPARRTERLVRLSSEIRAEVGERYPLGAIVPSPIRLRDDLAYWPGFPWHELALTYDAILPMTYFTFRAHGPAETLDYVSGCIEEIRAQVGSDRVPIHVIGGLARDESASEALAFSRAVREGGVIGASTYTWPYVTDEQWWALERIG
jgi:hypothetical protein